LVSIGERVPVEPGQQIVQVGGSPVSWAMRALERPRAACSTTCARIRAW
jgi:hypothetical protein